MYLVAESNGTSPMRGRSRLSSSTSTPALVASTTSAPSVGSPTSVALAWTAASLQSAAGLGGEGEWPGGPDRRRSRSDPPGRSRRPRRARCTGPRTTSLAVIWLSVRVPVLSEQITVVDPSVSTEWSRLTMALCFAIWLTPTASVTVTTAGRPSGMAATANATAPSSGVGDVDALGHLEHEHQGHGDAGDHGQPGAEPVELHLERRRARIGVGQEPGHPAHLGAPCPVAVTSSSARPRVTVVFM